MANTILVQSPIVERTKQNHLHGRMSWTVVCRLMRFFYSCSFFDCERRKGFPMKLKKIRFLSFVVVMILLVSLTTPLYAAAIAEEQENINAYKNYVAVEINGIFVDALTQSQFLSDYYAGAYIDKDGNYNICVTNNEALSALKNAVSSQDINRIKTSSISDIEVSKNIANEVYDLTVNYHVKMFSYNHLSLIVDVLSSDMISLGIECVGIKQADNVVDIYINANANKDVILSYLDNHISDFNDASVRFLESEKLVATANKTAYPGDEIYYTSWFTTYRGTIGFHAKDASGNYGLVTNSHVAPSGKSMKYDGKTVGTPSNSTIGGKIDAAFIPFNNTSSVTWQSSYALKEYNTTIYGSIYDVASSSQIVEGSRVKKYGITSGVNYGYITYTSQSCTYYDEDGNLVATLTDCIYFDNITQSGDSGGPVGLVAPIAKAKFYLTAITFAGNSATGVGCKVSNIVSAFNITPVTSVNP